MRTLHTWYFTTYGDRFFTPSTPPWFPALQFLELVYHVPLTLWALPALLRDDPRVPLALLVFGLETSMSTLVCFSEMRSWGELSDAQRGIGGLGGMYGVYLALGEFFHALFFKIFFFFLGKRSLGACAVRMLMLVVGVFMTLDCYSRLDGWIARQKGLVPVSKKEA